MRIETIYMRSPILTIGKLTACIGYFDGIHRGHQRLLKQVLAISKQDGSIPAMITFDPDPWTVLKHAADLTHLTMIEDRVRIAESFGIECMVILHFDEAMADCEVSQFHDMLKAMGVSTLVCGFDFHYAKYGQGNINTLLSQSLFQVSVCEPVMDGMRKISSSQIEELIQNGQISHANELLGYAYSIHGIVVQGNQVGRTIGFPTANIALQDPYVLPKSGVYAAMASVDNQTYRCMVNIGHNPTFNERRKLSVEAHLLNFHGDLYGLDLRLEFCCYLREEQKFKDKAALVCQLHKDIQAVAACLDEGE
ncbi:MAG: riboflavin biosynthesis protein RibF [Erysipelotrichaceae bacterium]|nr:riboflavin biosynthesis protein RibF [Erysipelotrichaceae bacterium]